MSHPHGKYPRSRRQGGGTSYTNNYPPTPPPQAHAEVLVERLPVNALTSVMQLLRQTQRSNKFDVQRDPMLWDHYLHGRPQYYPSYLDYPYLLSSGSKGYCALKEMLQNGVPGNTVVLESHDLRDVDEHTVGVVFRVLRGVTYPTNRFVFYERVSLRQNRRGQVVLNPIDIIYLTVFTNVRCLPTLLHHDEVRPMALDLSYLTATTSLPPRFLSGCHFLVGLALSSTLTTLPCNLLTDCSSLLSMDLSPLCGITKLPMGFLSGCSNLTALELPKGFLSECPNLTVLELHTGFLSECPSVTGLDLISLSSLRGIPDSFLQGCCGITTLDLHPLSHLTEVPVYFLKGCSGLTTLDLSPLSNITVVQRGFLEGCAGLTSLDLRPLSNLASISRGFLVNCTGITSLNFSPLSNVACIRGGFLHGCTNLTSLDLSPLTLLTSLPKGLLSGLVNLTSLTMNHSHHRPLRINILPGVTIVYK